jgi:hypothetical protein
MPDDPITLEVEVFRAGDYGDKGKYTPATLRQMADDYNTETHDAPVTLDHMQTGPAYGWVESVRAKGKKMFATLRDISWELQFLIESKMFKKRSVEIYPEFEGTGRPYLKAVSFLGAAAPHIKGMKDPEFIEGLPALCFSEGDHESFEFSEDEQEPSWFQGALDKFFARKKGEKDPDASDAGKTETPPDDSAATEEGNAMPEWGELTREQLREKRPDLLDAERDEAFDEGQAKEKQRVLHIFAAANKYEATAELIKKAVGDDVSEEKATALFADAKIEEMKGDQPEVDPNADSDDHSRFADKEDEQVAKIEEVTRKRIADFGEDPQDARRKAMREVLRGEEEGK